MRILVDHRERPARVPELLAREPDVQLVDAALSCGDYALGTRIGIERKTAEDFARSLVDGPREVAGVAWPALRGALVSVAVAFGVPVVHSTDPEESATLIAGIGRQLHRQFSLGYVRAAIAPRGGGGAPCSSSRASQDRPSPGGSVQAVVSADVATLAHVTGVGLRLAGGIRRAVESDVALSTPATDTAR